MTFFLLPAVAMICLSRRIGKRRSKVLRMRSAAWHAYPIEFHTLLRHRMHADFLPKTLV